MIASISCAVVRSAASRCTAETNDDRVVADRQPADSVNRRDRDDVVGYQAFADGAQRRLGRWVRLVLQRRHGPVVIVIAHDTDEDADAAGFGIGNRGEAVIDDQRIVADARQANANGRRRAAGRRRGGAGGARRRCPPAPLLASRRG